MGEPKVLDASTDRHCVARMHHGKSLVACIGLLHCVYGAQRWAICHFRSVNRIYPRFLV